METPEPWIRTIRKKYQFININGYTTLMGDNFEVEIYEADKKLRYFIIVLLSNHKQLSRLLALLFFTINISVNAQTPDMLGDNKF